jgi:hypothetical protein
LSIIAPTSRRETPLSLASFQPEGAGYVAIFSCYFYGVFQLGQGISGKVAGIIRQSDPVAFFLAVSVIEIAHVKVSFCLIRTCFL